MKDLLEKIKNDVIKFLLNLNVVVSKEEDKQEEQTENVWTKKKLVEMKNALVVQIKNINIVVDQFNLKNWIISPL